MFWRYGGKVPVPKTVALIHSVITKKTMSTKATDDGRPHHDSSSAGQ